MKLNGLEKQFKTNKNGEIIDFKQLNNEIKTPLSYSFYNNKKRDLNLNVEQFDYLIKNSDLKQVDHYDRTILMVALEYNKYENLNLSNEQWKYIIDNSDLSLITDERQLIKLKKIQSELLNNEILNKIDIKENNNKKNKI